MSHNNGAADDKAATDSTSAWSKTALLKGLFKVLSDIKALLPTSLSGGSLKSTLTDSSGNPIDFSAIASIINTSEYPLGATPVIAIATGANSVATASLPAVSGKTTYLVGYTIESLGAIAASIKNPTISNLIGSVTLTRILSVVAGVTTKNEILTGAFSKGIPASGSNTAIDVSCPALGAGNTSSIVIAWGYQLS